mmetsp:Transcript_42927/g.84157  ORF Transcript_42927/g.84157 Transcript_42927/m.84157 type:complete len:89 (+) Transcript_42927:3128-3394(+)|eukprot:CAMPEP_0175163278 /NCGR_PEP_ID=MMETSP0087-20121206/25657_1 /TAXON_ID=136419 /ORGANISM="Unknown Unknown, Strain D1" /LENGTH=88 /DNA_ID=CAMNT_0016451957 /DNA_START=377 /DNA_END=643 /DNA_ORIENTATION=+
MDWVIRLLGDLDKENSLANPRNGNLWSDGAVCDPKSISYRESIPGIPNLVPALLIGASTKYKGIPSLAREDFRSFFGSLAKAAACGVS